MKAFIKSIEGKNRWTSLKVFKMGIGDEVKVIEKQGKGLVGISFRSRGSGILYSLHYVHRSQLYIPRNQE